MDANQEQLLTTSEIAARLRISRNGAGRLCASGTIEAIRVGNLWRVSEAALRTYKAKVKHRPAVVTPAHRREEDARVMFGIVVAELKAGRA